MKWIARMSVFVAALAIGTVAAAVFLISRPLPVVHPPAVEVTGAEEMSLATSPSTVEVMYADWIKSGPGGRSYLRFIIHNGESDPLVYLSGSSTDPEPFIMVNGKEVRRPSTCENGLERFYIPPGLSASVLVPDFYFKGLAQNDAEFQIGFRFEDWGDQRKVIYSAAPLLLAEDFLSSTKHLAPEFDD